MAGESSQAARAKAEEILTAAWIEFINANPDVLLTAERAHRMRECKDLADKLMDARAECKRLERLIDADADADADALESEVEKIEHKMVALAAAIYARKLNRAQHVLLLESAGIECYDSESLDTLREALIANVVDGTIDLDALA